MKMFAFKNETKFGFKLWQIWVLRIFWIPVMSFNKTLLIVEDKYKLTKIKILGIRIF